MNKRRDKETSRQLKIKSIVDIARANCETCANIGNEDDGNYPEFAIGWAVCRKFPRYQYLKPFPFKTEQKCWEPEFWHSKFAAMVDGTDKSVHRAIDAFKEALNAVGV